MTEQSHGQMLQHLQQQQIITESQYQRFRQPAQTSWWLEVLIAIAAWVAALFILSAFSGTLFLMGDSAPVRFIGAIILLGGCCFMSRLPQDFLQQMAVAFSLAGQALMLWSLHDMLHLSEHQLYLVALIQAAALLFLPLNTAHRWLCSIIVLLCLHLLLDSLRLMACTALILTAITIVLWLSRVYRAGHSFSPLLKSVTEVLTLYALLAASFGQSYFSANYYLWWWLSQADPYINQIYHYGSAAILLLTGAWLSRHQPLIWRITAVAIMIVMSVLLQNAAGLLLSTAIMLATFYGCSKAWFRISLLFTLIYLSEFYYSLHITLLQKSGILLLGGVALLLLCVLLNYYQRRISCHSN